MLPSSACFLDKMMETMMMRMLNNQCKDTTPACSNRTCTNKRDQKSRKKRNHHRHCKKKRSRCPTDEVASIICIRKCMKKSKKPREKSKCPNPCSPGRKSRSVRIAICSSDSSASDPQYCSKCGQPLPGSTVPQKNSLEGPHLRHETHSKMYAEELQSPEETCITCHTHTTCTSCQNSNPFRSQPNVVGQCVPECDLFGSPYFLRNLNNSKSEGLCGGYSRNNIGLTGIEKQKECLVQVTCCENKTLNASSANKICSPPPDVGKSSYPAAVRIKRCGKNIVTVKCCEGGDFDVSCMKTDNNVGQNCSKRIISDSSFGIEQCENGKQSQIEETQCSRRFIQITEGQRSDYGRNCVTKVRCADYSSITSGARPSSNKNCAAEVPVMSSSSGRAPGNTNIGYSPCSDRGLSAVNPHSSPGHNMKPHVVRMKFVKPCHQVGCDFDSCCEIQGSSNITKAEMCCDPDDYESDCDEQPSCTCCVTKYISRPPILPFCYDPALDHYDNEFCDLPCQCIDEPVTTHYPSETPPYSQPPPPVYREPYEYRPAQSSPVNQSSIASSDTEKSLPPVNHYGYDFFYGTVRPPTHSGEKKSSNKSS